MADRRSLSQIAQRQRMDWDRYAGKLRGDALRAMNDHPNSAVVQSFGGHIALLLDEVDALRHDIRRAYDIANEYLNEAIRLRAQNGETDEADV